MIMHQEFKRHITVRIYQQMELLVVENTTNLFSKVQKKLHSKILNLMDVFSMVNLDLNIVNYPIVKLLVYQN